MVLGPVGTEMTIFRVAPGTMVALVATFLPPRRWWRLIAGATVLAALPAQIVLVTRHARPAVPRRALATGDSCPRRRSWPGRAEIIRDVAASRGYVDPDIAASALTEDDCPLTDREPEVLRAARTGASVNDIAAEVHLTGTVRDYLSAAHYAWQQGWI
jgi:two-component system response regulator DesR